jgi:hypothetical protein
MRKTLRSGWIETARRPPLQSAANAIDADVPSATTALEGELAELERLSLDDLRLRWRNNWGRLAPAHLSRALLFRLMAYRLQAEAFGDLDRKTVRMLERLADDAANKSAANGSAAPGSDERAESKLLLARAAHEPLILKLGVVLIREWQGRLERVTVVDDGFGWNGATFASLSAAALAITGTKWNGHRFFGVRRQDRNGASKCDDDSNRERPSRSVCGKTDLRPLKARGSSSPSASVTTDGRERVP